jgi:predicted acyltransferase
LEAHLQLTGVLQKIAVCYLVAFHIYVWTGLRGVIVGILGLNLLYLGLLYFYPVPGCGPGSLAVSCNFPGYLDATVLDGFRWNSTAFDPDGVGTILPAITSPCSACSRDSSY